MVQVQDGIGRILYVLDTTTNKRYHPYTNEEVGDDFEYQYEPKSFAKADAILNWLPFAIIGLGSIIICICILLNN